MEKIAEPLEYIRGFTEFLGCKIDLSKKPLIPRVETEFWVSKAINSILAFCRMQECCKDKNIKILDIFTGSGCIGLAVLSALGGPATGGKRVLVTFADKEKKCIDQVKINLKINNATGIVRQSDVFSNIKGKFDYIFANPPYVARKKIKQIQKSVLQHEPHSALFGGQDGLYYIKKFLKQASVHLSTGGRIFLEFSPEQKKAIGELLKSLGYKAWKFNKDQFDRFRWVEIDS